MLTVTFLLFVGVYASTNPLQTLLENARLSLVGEQCPYNSMNGLSKYCNTSNVNSQYNTKFNTKYLRAKIGLGWDSINNKVKLPFLELSYNKNKNYTSNSKKLYAVPDQISLKRLNVSNEIVNTQIYKTIHEYLNNINTHEINSLLIMEVPEIIQQFSHGTNSITNTEEIHYNLELEYTLPYSPNAYAKGIIDNLPLDYDEDFYELFFRYFGDSVIIKAKSGIVGNLLIAIKSCYGSISLGDSSNTMSCSSNNTRLAFTTAFKSVTTIESNSITCRSNMRRVTFECLNRVTPNKLRVS